MRKSRYLKIAAVGLRPAPQPIRGHLVLIDARPIRNDATRKYRHSKTRFADLQRHLARFQDHDKPKFERWLQSTFGGLIGELRSTQGEMNRLRELIFEVETRTWFNNQSCAAAYRDVLDRQARRRENPSAPSDDDLEEKMRAHLEAEARDNKEDEKEARQPGGPPHRPNHLGAEKESRLKAAYRSMARRLHPDRHAHVTPQMRERWHAAQQAYMAGDVDLLESMETLCHDEEEEVSAETPVSLILDRIRRLTASITQLNTKVQHAQREPSWGFSELKDFTRIKRMMGKTLPTQIKAAREEIQELEEKIEQWQTDAERFYPGFKEAHKDAIKNAKKGRAAAAQAHTPPPARPAAKGTAMKKKPAATAARKKQAA